ncbi:MAG TPA: FxLYD domain-containing protein [Armatimonadota bacterium]|jgi:hypothetical protein
MDTPQQLPHETLAPPKKKSTWWIWLIVIVVVIGAMNTKKDSGKPTIAGANAGTPAHTATAAKDDPNTYHGKIKLTDVKWEHGAYGISQIVGLAENISGSELTYAQVEINLLDASGTTVGSTMANINNLAAGAKWKFKAPVLEQSAKKFEIKDVTAM